MRIKNEQAYWCEEKRSEISHFEERAAALAVETHNGEIARAFCSAAKKNDPRGKKRQLSTVERKSSSEDSTDSQSTDIDGDTASVRKWDSKCLNPDCEEFHRIKDCPITTPEIKKELLNKYYSEARKKRRISEKKSD